MSAWPSSDLHRAQVRAAFEQMGGEGVAKHVRADPLGRNAGVRGHLPDELVEPHPAQMRLAAGEQPQRSARHMLAPCPDHRCARATRSAPAAPCPPLPRRIRNGRPGGTAPRGQADQFGRAQPRTVKQLEQGEIAHGGDLAACGAVLCGSNMREISGSSRMRGSGRSKRGRGSAADGSSRRSPSSTRKPKNRRSAADRRATVAGASSAHSAPSRDRSSAEAVASETLIASADRSRSFR